MNVHYARKMAFQCLSDGTEVVLGGAGMYKWMLLKWYMFIWEGWQVWLFLLGLTARKW